MILHYAPIAYYGKGCPTVLKQDYFPSTRDWLEVTCSQCIEAYRKEAETNLKVPIVRLYDLYNF